VPSGSQKRHCSQRTGSPDWHVPLLHVSPTVQGLPSSQGMGGIVSGFATVVHTPLTQALTRHGASAPSGSGHAMPHLPQLSTSVSTSVHLPAKLRLSGSGQTSGVPVGQTQLPALHVTAPVGQQCFPQTICKGRSGQQNLSAAEDVVSSRHESPSQQCCAAQLLP
jgi:hypothetical protein